MSLRSAQVVRYGHKATSWARAASLSGSAGAASRMRWIWVAAWPRSSSSACHPVWWRAGGIASSAVRAWESRASVCGSRYVWNAWAASRLRSAHAVSAASVSAMVPWRLRSASSAVSQRRWMTEKRSA
ncbi:hypothetical protein [Streptomyces sp. NPDC019890]|uniref:hypothetical protein n=1 Tax=Streptomyces sp. NPDC019890 TaxID=3365064 RepID=UPI00384DA652